MDRFGIHVLYFLGVTGLCGLALNGCGAVGENDAVIPAQTVDEEPAESTVETGYKAPLNEPGVGYPVAPHGDESADQSFHKVDEDLKVKPTVVSLEPAVGPSIGGDVVTIKGDNFADGCDVYFNDKLATDTFFISNQYINVVTPAGKPGPVDITVTNPDGAEGTLEAGFVYKDGLEVANVEPATGASFGGEPVSIYGSGFVPGVVVLFGQRKALQVEVISGGEIACITPPGDAGWVDVRAVIEGDMVANLSNGYRYAAAPVVETAWPPSGPTIGGTTLEILGRYFTPDIQAKLGGKDAGVVSVAPDGKKMSVLTPGGSVGPVELQLSTPDGTVIRPNAFTYLAPAQSGVKLWSVSPASGSATGGYSATLVVQGLDPELSVDVKFGGFAAKVISTDQHPESIVVEVPPGAPGVVDVQIEQAGMSDLLESGFMYTQPLKLSSISPASGSEKGGELVSLFGEGFKSVSAQDLTVHIGPLGAIETTIVSDEQIEVIAPPCPPGLLDVVVTAGSAKVLLAGAFECRSEQTRIYAIDPAEGAQAGGTLLQVIGVGLPVGAAFMFNDEPATDVQYESSLSYWVRSPRGDVGVANVTMTTDEIAESAELAGAFSYFDPANKKSPVWGGPIDRSVNVTIFNGSNGKRIKGGLAVLGASADTEYQCKTDDRGQCVISHHGLAGKQTITAAKQFHSAYTIAGFNGTNVSVFIRPQQAPPNLGPPGVAEQAVDISTLIGKISGKVSNIGKMIKPPPGDCNIIGSPDGKQCTACDEQTPCSDGLSCQVLGKTGAWCVETCESTADCAPGYVCGNVGSGDHCIPYGGKIEVKCNTSQRSFFGSNPKPGPGEIVDLQTYEYSINARLGEVTVYCVGGYYHPYNNSFIPVVMGINEHNYVTLGNGMTDVDVTLNIPLTKTLRTRVYEMPEHEAGIKKPLFNIKVDIGAEGWIPFNKVPTYSDGELVYFAGYPESLKPFGKDAAYTFYSVVQAKVTSGGVPGSYQLIHRLKSVDGEPLLERGEEGPWAAPGSGMTGNLTSLWGANPDDVWAVGVNGRIVHRGTLGWGPQPTVTQTDLNTVWGDSVDNVWAMGEKGTILHFDGVKWSHHISSGTVPWDIRSVHGPWAVGDGGLLHFDDTKWSAHATLHSKGMRAVRFINENDVVAVGQSGKALQFNGKKWKAILAHPDSVTLNALWDNGSSVFAVGNAGAVLVREPSGEWVHENVPTQRDLYAVTGDANGVVYAAGGVGTVLRRNTDGVWTNESSAESSQLDVSSLWTNGQSVYGVGVNSLPMGPWMAFVQPINPTWYEFMENDRAEWGYLKGGPEPTYNYLSMTSSDGYTVWGILTAGPISEVQLPPLTQMIEHDPLPPGQKYFNIQRSLNPEFSIDGFRWKHTSMWRRTTWASVFGIFY